MGFVRRSAVEYLDDDDAATRREAALTCCRLLDVRSDRAAGGGEEGSVHGGLGGGYNSPSSSMVSGSSWSAGTEAYIMSRLLAAAVSDLDTDVRRAVLASFCRPSPVTDSHLGQAEALRALFVTLNDESSDVRLIAVRLVGRLAPRNPAYALPALRRHLLQLITELEHSTESHIREESARLLAALVRSCTRLVLPYIAPMLQTLTRKLRKPEDVKGDHPGGGGGSGGGGGGAVASERRGIDGAAIGDKGAAVGGGFGREADVGGVAGAASEAAEGALAAAVDGEARSSAANAMTTGATANAAAVAAGVGSRAGASVGSSGPQHIISVREKAAVLGAVGELAQVGAAGMRAFVPELLVLVIDGIKMGSTRDIAVVTMGQLIESTGYVIRPFMDHPQLLSLMLRILAEEAGPVRVEVLRTLGILGALDPHSHRDNEERLHGQGLLSMEGVRGVGRGGAGADGDEKGDKVGDKAAAAGGGKSGAGSVGGGFPGLDGDDILPARNLTTASENFYPTVALNALLRVLKDPTMASHHHMVVRSIMFIFRALGLSCVQYLPATMPVILQVMRTCEDGLREFMLAQLTALVAIIRGHVRRYLDEILDIVRSFWGPGPLLRQMLRLCEELAVALHDDFRAHLPDLLPRMIAVLAEAERSGNFSAVPSVLHALEAFGSATDEHLHLMLPALVRLFRPGVAPVPTPIRSLVLRSLAALLPRMQLAGHASAVVHPLLRVIDGPVKELRKDAMSALTSMAHALGLDFLLFLPLARRTMAKRGIRDPVFERLAEQLVAQRDGMRSGAVGTATLGALGTRAGLPIVPGLASTRDESAADARGGSVYRGGSVHRGGSVRGGDIPSLLPPSASRHLVVDEAALRRAWESSQRSTKEDWLEWMRHLSVELLKQSPSPALRACIDLAMVQPHLARDLFCASFVSCWAELSQTNREALVRSIEAAFGSPTIPPEIVTTLLNLAEFCEHDEKPLPVDIRTLGMIAERCRAYAKALHYKETEFISNPAACVEAIIAINNQLQLPEAAMGVLVYAQAHLRLEIKEGWYEKLGQWDNALEAYRRKAVAADAALREADAAIAAAPGHHGAPAHEGSRGRRRREVAVEGASSRAPERSASDGISDASDSTTTTSREDSTAGKRPGAYPPDASPSLASLVLNRASANTALEARREAALGQMRCLAALAEWEALGKLCASEWERSAGTGPPGAGGVGVGGDAVIRGQMAPIAAQAAWHLGDWARMETYSDAVAEAEPRARLRRYGGARHGGIGAAAVTTAGGFQSATGNATNAIDLATDVDFYRAVLAVRKGDVERARGHVAAARDALGAELAALVTESYDRSYGGMVRVQQLTELEEVIEYAELGRRAAEGGAGGASGGVGGGESFAVSFPGGFEGANVGDAHSASARRELMRSMWRERIYGVQRKVEVWQSLLAVRSLVLPMREETETWLKFASLNRKAGRTRQAHRTLLRLLDYDPSRCAPGSPGYGAGSGRPDVMLAYVKHQWALGNRRDAFARLQSLVGELGYGDARMFRRAKRKRAFSVAAAASRVRSSRPARVSFSVRLAPPRARVMSTPKIDQAAEPGIRVAADAC